MAENASVAGLVSLSDVIGISLRAVIDDLVLVVAVKGGQGLGRVEAAVDRLLAAVLTSCSVGWQLVVKLSLPLLEHFGHNRRRYSRIRRSHFLFSIVVICEKKNDQVNDKRSEEL